MNNRDGVVTHLQPDILDSEVKWAIGSITTNKASGGDRIPVDLFSGRRLLRAPWTARRSNLSILKEISPGCSLEGLMLKLKVQYFDHLM